MHVSLSATSHHYPLRKPLLQIFDLADCPGVNLKLRGLFCGNGSCWVQALLPFLPLLRHVD